MVRYHTRNPIEKEDDRYVEHLVVCTIENGEWIEEMETSIDEIHNIIASFSNLSYGLAKQGSP